VLFLLVGAYLVLTHWFGTYLGFWAVPRSPPRTCLLSHNRRNSGGYSGPSPFICIPDECASSLRRATCVISDEDLMISAGQGDMSAFEQVVRRHQDSVWRVACRFLRNAEDARDVAQTVFLKLFEAAPRYRRTASLKTYLFRIVRTTCVDSTRRKRPFAVDRLPDIADGSPLPSESLAARTRDQAVKQATQALPLRQRTAIVLKYEAELSVWEIGEVMKTSEKAVERLLARARDSLYPVLKDLHAR
jgi:RNA polymerase sigma-70 factor, ECF subfamily